MMGGRASFGIFTGQPANDLNEDYVSFFNTKLVMPPLQKIRVKGVTALSSSAAVATTADGVVTIEGISRDGLTPLQQAFVEEDAVQCGYCTAGQVVAATALLERVPSPTAAEVHDAMAGNLCRCGCYEQITAAILSAAETAETAETAKTADR
jgi:aerobic-type carbon monoxide dehydrogenase small subunit (CoxS/CutS family)